MYKRIFRPLFFKCSPESIHDFVINGLKFSGRIGADAWVRRIAHPDSLHMETDFCGIKFPNKIGVAAGLDKNAEVYDMLGNLGFGHVEIGTVTPKGQSGNPKPRAFRLPTDQALINRMGFNNHGVEAAVQQLRKRDGKLIIGGNIGKNTLTANEDALADYVCCFNGLYDHVDYITVNVSCPNISNLHKLQDQDELEKILNTLDAERKEKSVYKPILMKISPDLNPGQVDETLDVIKKCNIDGIIAANTTTLREPLKTDANTVEAIGKGGLSGFPVRDRSTELIRYISQKTNGQLPIIGVGGIFTPEDALEKLNAGATLVQVYTGFVYEGPGMAKRINTYLKREWKK